MGLGFNQEKCVRKVTLRLRIEEHSPEEGHLGRRNTMCKDLEESGARHLQDRKRAAGGTCDWSYKIDLERREGKDWICHWRESEALESSEQGTEGSGDVADALLPFFT